MFAIQASDMLEVTLIGYYRLHNLAIRLPLIDYYRLCHLLARVATNWIL